MKQLKTISLFVALLCSMFVVSSCGSDNDNDDDGARDSQLIAEASGTWMCVESTDTQYGYTAEGLLVGKEVTIKKDGTFTSTAPSFGKSGTFTVSGNSITAKSEVGTFVVTVTVSGGKMTWDGTASNGVSFHYVFQREY